MSYYLCSTCFVCVIRTREDENEVQRDAIRANFGGEHRRRREEADQSAAGGKDFCRGRCGFPRRRQAVGTCINHVGTCFDSPFDRHNRQVLRRRTKLLEQCVPADSGVQPGMDAGPACIALPQGVRRKVRQHHLCERRDGVKDLLAGDYPALTAGERTGHRL